MRKKTLLLIFIILGGLLIPIISMATSPPPQIIRLVTVTPPDDLEVVLVTPIEYDFAHQQISPFPRTSSRLWETTYNFTLTVHGGRLDHERLIFQFSSQELGDFEMDLPLHNQWTTVVYLNLNTQTYTIHPYLWRNPLILLIWIVGLISVEAFFFLLFSNRSKRHWKIFAHNSILTQGLFILCWFLFTFMISDRFFILAVFIGIPLFFTLFGLRIHKLVMDLKTLPRLLPEISKGRIIIYVLLANLFSGIMAIHLGTSSPHPEVSFISMVVALTALIVVWRLLSLKRDALGWRRHKLSQGESDVVSLTNPIAGYYMKKINWETNTYMIMEGNLRMSPSDLIFVHSKGLKFEEIVISLSDILTIQEENEAYADYRTDYLTPEHDMATFIVQETSQRIIGNVGGSLFRSIFSNKEANLTNILTGNAYIRHMLKSSDKWKTYELKKSDGSTHWFFFKNTSGNLEMMEEITKQAESV